MARFRAGIVTAWRSSMSGSLRASRLLTMASRRGSSTGWLTGRSRWAGLRRGVMVIDEDLGRSAANAADRPGCRSVCGPTGLVIPARRAARRTIRAAPCRSSRRPSAVRKTGPSLRSPTARSIARAVRRASGMVTTLPPLRVMTSVRWPRSTPSASMLAPVASETRKPFSASSEMRACSPGSPRPAATSSAPSSLRSSPVAWDS